MALPQPRFKKGDYVHLDRVGKLVVLKPVRADIDGQLSWMYHVCSVHGKVGLANERNLVTWVDFMGLITKRPAVT